MSKFVLQISFSANSQPKTFVTGSEHADPKNIFQLLPIVEAEDVVGETKCRLLEAIVGDLKKAIDTQFQDDNKLNKEAMRPAKSSDMFTSCT